MMKLLLATWLAASLARGSSGQGGWAVSNTAAEEAAETTTATTASTNDYTPCFEEKIPFNPFQQKKVYTVGIHAIDGLEAAKKETNATFGEYLTQTAGQMFDPPIAFRVVPLYFDGIFKAIDNEELDFLYR